MLAHTRLKNGCALEVTEGVKIDVDGSRRGGII